MRCDFCRNKATTVVWHVLDQSYTSIRLCCNACWRDRKQPRFRFYTLGTPEADRLLATRIANGLRSG